MKYLKLPKIIIGLTIFIIINYFSVYSDDSIGRTITPVEIVKKHVIIWTEARTGSALLADMLSRARSTYYISDPINTLVGWGRNLSSSQLDELTEFIKRILSCDFSKPKEFWKNYREYRHYQNAPLRDLYADYNLEYLWNTSVTDEFFCKASNIVLTKQSVLPLKQSIQLFKDPSLNPYILHLVHDPRPLLLSRIKLKGSNSSVLRIPNFSNATILCTKLKENLDQLEVIKELYPQRYLRIRYEDLTQDAEFTTRQILGWMGMPYNAAVAANIADNTLGFANHDAHHHIYSTYRDSLEHQRTWRQQLGFNQVLSIQEACKEVMGRLGYRIYNTSSEYTDLTVHSAERLYSKFEL